MVYRLRIMILLLILLFLYGCVTPVEEEDILGAEVQELDRIAEKRLRSFFPQEENAEYIIIKDSTEINEVDPSDTYSFKDIRIYRDIPVPQSLDELYIPYVEITFTNKQDEIYSIREAINIIYLEIFIYEGYNRRYTKHYYLHEADCHDIFLNYFYDGFIVKPEKLPYSVIGFNEATEQNHYSFIHDTYVDSTMHKGIYLKSFFLKAFNELKESMKIPSLYDAKVYVDFKDVELDKWTIGLSEALGHRPDGGFMGGRDAVYLINPHAPCYISEGYQKGTFFLEYRSRDFDNCDFKYVWYKRFVIKDTLGVFNLVSSKIRNSANLGVTVKNEYDITKYFLLKFIDYTYVTYQNGEEEKVYLFETIPFNKEDPNYYINE